MRFGSIRKEAMKVMRPLVVTEERKNDNGRGIRKRKLVTDGIFINLVKNGISTLAFSVQITMGEAR